MNKTEAQTLYTQLISETAKLNKAYYEDDNPLVNDTVWDEKMRQIKQIEAEFPDLLKPNINK